MRTYQITENNGGGLTLYVWDNDKLIYAHAGYEYNPSQLRDDLAALADSDTSDWDGNDLTNEDIIHAVRDMETHDGREITDDMSPLTEDEYYDYHETTKVICDQDGPVSEDNMGAAGRSVFYPEA